MAVWSGPCDNISIELKEETRARCSSSQRKGFLYPSRLAVLHGNAAPIALGRYEKQMRH